MTPVPPAENRSRRGLLATVGVLAVVGISIGVIAAFGGLRREPHPVPNIGPGRPVDAGLFTVVPLEARMTSIRSFSGPPKKAITVRARVTNRGDRSFPVTTFLGGVRAEPAPGRLERADQMESTGLIAGDKTGEIHPRLPIDVQMVWQLPQSATPQTIHLVFRLWEYDQSFTTDEFEWTVGTSSPVAARVTLPVQAGAAS